MLEIAQFAGRPVITPAVEQWIVDEYVRGATLAQLGRAMGTHSKRVWFIIDQTGRRQECVRAAREAREEHQQQLIAEIARNAGPIFGLKPGRIWLDNRKSDYTLPRYAVFAVSVEMGCARAAIARAFEIDHTTVIYGLRRAEIFERRDPEFRWRIERLREAVNGERLAA